MASLAYDFFNGFPERMINEIVLEFCSSPLLQGWSQIYLLTSLERFAFPSQNWTEHLLD